MSPLSPHRYIGLIRLTPNEQVLWIAPMAQYASVSVEMCLPSFNVSPVNISQLEEFRFFHKIVLKLTLKGFSESGVPPPIFLEFIRNFAS